MSSSFIIVHAKDGEQHLVPRALLPDEQQELVSNELHIPYPSTLIKRLIVHLIERNKQTQIEQRDRLDTQWFHSIQSTDYVEIVFLTKQLHLNWATQWFIRHVAEQLRSENWSILT
jgi:hypothetical protein